MDFYRYWNEVNYSCFKKGFRKKKSVKAHAITPKGIVGSF